MTDIEKTYQKKTQLEHILLRPLMWVYDQEKDKLVQREISYVPGLYKIFDEILVNAADNKQRDPKMNLIKVNINKEKNEISILNNGKGIPVVMHNVEKMYVPEMIFGTLLTSSNYNDDERKVTGGRNGYGAKLCNIFSTKFVLETSCKEYNKKFKQTWVNSMTKQGEAVIEKSTEADFTKITFRPDLKRFGMTELDDDIVGLMCRRAFDVAGSTKGVKVFLNSTQIPGFKAYVDRYVKDKDDESGEPLKIAYEQIGTRWEIALAVSDRGFQQVSFVNSIATSKGGRHVDYVTDQIIAKLIETVKKKIGKNSINIKPFQVKNHLWVFVNALIENPTFDSQTKETMTLQAKSFGSKCEISEKFIKEAHKCGIIESIMSWVRFKQSEQQDKTCSGKKSAKVKGVPKLEDANDAGTKNSHLCTLILTEGDSAKTLAVAGLGVIGRDRYGVFPLRGKLLNVREGSHKQIMENVEICAMLKILGLHYKLKYTDEEEYKKLRYGKIMIMADQDQDGSHIKGLVINFIHCNWPHLLKRNFVEEFITPIVKATKGKEERSFYSIPEYVEWRQNTENWKTYRIKYYKGLGTSSSKEAKEYFSDMAKHRIPFKYSGPEDDNAVDLAFSKKKVDDRKEWLTSWMEIRKERRLKNEIEDYLYDKDTRFVTYSDFINKELVLFSNADNERSIPSLVDGLKPGQRKVLFTCFKRADKKEVKVAQLAGAVGEMSAYHHGEASLMMTIVNLAQDYVGSNNINLLLPIGQFGTRLQGGKDSASPRYIFTQLNPVAKALFPTADENVLRFLYEENQRIEPEWYCPIIPTVLVNGAEGIGTGWSTKVPNYNPRDVVKNIRRLIKGDSQVPLVPWYKNFHGTINQLDENRYVASGEIATLSEDSLEITELPVKTWTQNYKESVIEPMMESTENKPAQILDFKEYHSDQTVKFIIKMAPEKLRAAEREGLHKVFKLQTVLHTSGMVLFDSTGCLRKFSSPEEICLDFFEVRKNLYIERKRWMEGMLRAQTEKMSEQARFILLKIDNKLQIENKRKIAIVEQLVKNNFAPDPVKKWKELQKKRELELCGEAAAADDEEDEDQAFEGGAERPEKSAVEKKLSDYDYLAGMAIWKLSLEDKDKLLDESQAKKTELRALESKQWSDLWEADLVEFMDALNKHEKKEEASIEESIKNTAKKLMKENAGGRGAKKFTGFSEIKPNPNAIRVVPNLDSMKEKYEPKVKRPKAEKAEKANGEPKAKRTKKEKSESSESVTVITKPANKAKVKKTKKKNATSSDEEMEDTDEDVVYSDSEEEMEDYSTVAKEKPKKTRALKEKIENGNSDNGFVEINDDDVMVVKEPVVKEKPKPKKTPHQLSDNSDDEDAFDTVEEVRVVSRPARAVVKRTTRVVNSSDESEEGTGGQSESEDDYFRHKAQSKGKPAKKKAISDDDVEEDYESVKSKPKPKSKPKAPKKKNAGSDEEDDLSEGTSKPKPKAKPAVKKAVEKKAEAGGMRQFLESSSTPAEPERPTRTTTKRTTIIESDGSAQSGNDSDFEPIID